MVSNLLGDDEIDVLVEPSGTYGHDILLGGWGCVVPKEGGGPLLVEMGQLVGLITH